MSSSIGGLAAALFAGRRLSMSRRIKRKRKKTMAVTNKNFSTIDASPMRRHSAANDGKSAPSHFQVTENSRTNYRGNLSSCADADCSVSETRAMRNVTVAKIGATATRSCRAAKAIQRQGCPRKVSGKKPMAEPVVRLCSFVTLDLPAKSRGCRSSVCRANTKS